MNCSPSIPAGAASGRGVTVVVPTYREVESIPHLVRRLEALREAERLDLDFLLMADDSGDGTEDLVRSLDEPWIRLVVRRTCRSCGRLSVRGGRLDRR